MLFQTLPRISQQLVRVVEDFWEGFETALRRSSWVALCSFFGGRRVGGVNCLCLYIIHSRGSWKSEYTAGKRDGRERTGAVWRKHKQRRWRPRCRESWTNGGQERTQRVDKMDIVEKTENLEGGIWVGLTKVKKIMVLDRG